MSYTSREVYEFISQQTSDPIIEWRICDVSGTEFPIFQSDKDFLDKISPSFAGQKFVIPLPTICPEERERRRLLFRNERKLYRRKCSASGADIISMYSPDKTLKIYDYKIWRSDNRDAMNYWKEFDFSKTFTENFKLLYYDVPQMSLKIQNSENSDYTNLSIGNKSSYLCAGWDFWENCMYSTFSFYSLWIVDSYRIFNSQYISNSIYLQSCSSCHYCQSCKDCYHCIWCYRCEWCQFCYRCTNLVNKKYMINNVQYTKEEYDAFMIDNTDYSYIDWSPIKNIGTKIINSELCHGNNIENSKHCILSTEMQWSEYDKYCFLNSELHYSYDTNHSWHQSSYIYNTESVTESFSIVMSLYCRWQNNNLLYCTECYNNTHHCFWCIWLRNKSYCIFNKQYTQEDYEIQVAKIIAHMQSSWERWEFFHPSLSPFGYNETVAYEYYPLSPSEAWTKGYKRQINNYDPIIPAWVDTLCKKDLSDRERSMLRETDDILKKIIICESSGRPFRIIRQELEYYRAHHLPLPSYHPDIRHEQRNKLRPWKQLFLRNCIACGTTMLSVYETEENIYCESCYQKEVFG